MNLNQVTLPASDIEQSVAFYTKMGFTLIVQAEHYARFECPEGDATFSIHQAERVTDNPDVVVYFETEHLDQTVSRLEKIGFDFFQHPRNEPWLWREARLYDTSGNIICLYWAGENRKNSPYLAYQKKVTRKIPVMVFSQQE